MNTQKGVPQNKYQQQGTFFFTRSFLTVVLLQFSKYPSANHIFAKIISDSKISSKILSTMGGITFKKQLELSAAVESEEPELYFDILNKNKNIENLFSLVEEITSELRDIIKNNKNEPDIYCGGRNERIQSDSHVSVIGLSDNVKGNSNLFNSSYRLSKAETKGSNWSFPI